MKNAHEVARVMTPGNFRRLEFPLTIAPARDWNQAL